MTPYYHNDRFDLTIVHADCLTAFGDLAPESLDFIVTSPPYAQKFEYEPDLDWDGLNELTHAWAAAAYPVLKASSFCVVVFGETSRYEKTMAELYNAAFRAHNFVMHSRRVWVKDLGRLSLPRSGIRYTYPIPEWEFIWTFRKPPHTKEIKRAPKFTSRGIWDTTGEDAMALPKSEHPAPFPVGIPVRAILSWTDERDLVLDPFGGSGTTLIACAQTKRRGLMFEREEAYCELAARRLESYLDAGLFPDDQAVAPQVLPLSTGKEITL